MANSEYRKQLFINSAETGHSGRHDTRGITKQEEFNTQDNRATGQQDRESNDMLSRIAFIRNKRPLKRTALWTHSMTL